MLNGDIPPATKEPVDDVSSKTNNGPKPSAERCCLSESGDQQHNEIGSPISATSLVSENGGDCCALVSGNEDCSGMFDIGVIYYI